MTPNVLFFEVSALRPASFPPMVMLAMLSSLEVRRQALARAVRPVRPCRLSAPVVAGVALAGSGTRWSRRRTARTAPAPGTRCPGAAERHGPNRRLERSDLVGRVAAVGLVVRVAAGEVHRELLGARQAAQQRQLDLAVDFLHRVRAARDGGGGEVVQVAGLHVGRRRVVDLRPAVLDAERAARVAVRQLEQRAVRVERDRGLLVLRGAVVSTKM